MKIIKLDLPYRVEVWLGVLLPFLFLIVATGFMLSGQEQFVEDVE